MRETGLVVAVNGDRADVEVSARSTCKGCSAAGICNWTGENKKRVVARNEFGAAVGQQVVIETPEQGRTLSALLVFGVPVVLMLAGVLVGGLLLKKDLWAGVGSGIGLGLGLLVVKWFDLAARRSGRGLPVIAGLAQRTTECLPDVPARPTAD